MKKITLFLACLTMAVSSVSCSSDDSPAPVTSTSNTDLLVGWWYPNYSSSGYYYKAYYFGANGEYKQDMTNFGLGTGTGTWSWEDEDTIKMIPDANGGIVGGTQYVDVAELSDNVLSVTMFGMNIKCDRTQD